MNNICHNEKSSFLCYWAIRMPYTTWFYHSISKEAHSQKLQPWKIQHRSIFQESKKLEVAASIPFPLFTIFSEWGSECKWICAHHSYLCRRGPFCIAYSILNIRKLNLWLIKKNQQLHARSAICRGCLLSFQYGEFVNKVNILSPCDTHLKWRSQWHVLSVVTECVPWDVQLDVIDHLLISLHHFLKAAMFHNHHWPYPC